MLVFQRVATSNNLAICAGAFKNSGPLGRTDQFFKHYDDGEKHDGDVDVKDDHDPIICIYIYVYIYICIYIYVI